MTGYMVRVIDPATKGHSYPHARCFFDHAESCSLALHDMGMRGTRQIIFGANLLASYPEPIPADSLIFNLEAHSSGWMTDAYLDLLRQHPVLDYAESNVGWLRARGVDARYCPIRYHSHLTRLTLLPEAERDIDCLFYGGATERRHQIMARVWQENPGRNVVWYDHEQWNKRDDAITRAKILLNLHAYDGAPFEMARVSLLLANKCFVISEGPAEAEFKNIVMFQSAASIATACWLWLRDPQGRQRVAERGYQEFSQMKQSDVLAKALEGW